MPLAVVLCAAVSCTAAAGGPEPLAFRSECMSFEHLVLKDEVVVRRVEGQAVVGEGEDFEPLHDVQIAVRDLDTGAVKFTFADPSGRFELPWLPAGRYKLWTCLDGFDQIETEVRVDGSAPRRELRVYVPVSEEGTGWGLVDLVEKR